MKPLQEKFKSLFNFITVTMVQNKSMKLFCSQEMLSIWSRPGSNLENEVSFQPGNDYMQQADFIIGLLCQTADSKFHKFITISMMNSIYSGQVISNFMCLSENSHWIEHGFDDPNDSILVPLFKVSNKIQEHPTLNSFLFQEMPTVLTKKESNQIVAVSFMLSFQHQIIGINCWAIACA